MATNPLDKVYLNNSQLETLAGGGSITSGDDTYTADLNALYLTDDVPVCLTGSSAPTTSTNGYVGQFYLDTIAPKLYQCTAVTAQGTNPETYQYTWHAVSTGGKYLHVFCGDIAISGNQGQISFSYIDNDPSSLSAQAQSYAFDSLLAAKLKSLGFSNTNSFLGCTGRYDINTSNLDYKGDIYGIYGASNGVVYLLYNRLVKTSDDITIDGNTTSVITSINLESVFQSIGLNKNNFTEKIITL